MVPGVFEAWGRRAGWSFPELLAMGGKAQGSAALSEAMGSPHLGQADANPRQPLPPQTHKLELWGASDPSAFLLLGFSGVVVIST